MAKLGRQFEEDTSWWDAPGDAPLSAIPERSQRIIEASRPESSSYGHSQDALHDQKLFDAKVSKHGEDPAKLQSSVQRGRPYREEKRVREEIDLEQSWPYMNTAERAQHMRAPTGEPLEGKFLGARREIHEDQHRQYNPEHAEHHPVTAARRAFAYTLATGAFIGSLLPDGSGPRVTPVSKVSR